MYEVSVRVSGLQKNYLILKMESPAICDLQIEAGDHSEYTCLYPQRLKSCFMTRSPLSAYTLRFRSHAPFTVDLVDRRRRPASIGLLEVIDEFRRKHGSLWPEIKTESGVLLRDISFGNFMPAALSNAERVLFSGLKLDAPAEEIGGGDDPKTVTFADHPLRVALSFCSSNDDDEFLFVADAGKFSSRSRKTVSRFVHQEFGDPVNRSGRAWDLMRENSALGMVYWGMEPPSRNLASGKRPMRRLRSLFNLGPAMPVGSTGQPTLFLMRKNALSYLRAIGIEPEDLESGLYDEEALASLLPYLVEMSGYAFAALPRKADEESAGKPVEAAKWVDFRQPGPLKAVDLCMFVGLIGRDGTFSEHTMDYLRVVKQTGRYVYALGVALGDPADSTDPGPEYCDAFAARENDGHDFGIWAAALLRTQEAWNANSLLFANDSVVVSKTLLTAALDQLGASAFDVTGATKSSMGGNHLQSYFIHLNKAALQTPAVRRFWDSVRSWKDKNRIISLYEIAMTAKFARAGLKWGAMFGAGDGGSHSNHNPTIHDWKGLIEDGGPFLKTQVLRDLVKDPQWSEHSRFLRAHGFNVAQIEREFR